jgi:hypothetical protein
LPAMTSIFASSINFIILCRHKTKKALPWAEPFD